MLMGVPEGYRGHYSDHGSTLSNAPQRLTKITGAAHEWNYEQVRQIITSLYGDGAECPHRMIVHNLNYAVELPRTGEIPNGSAIFSDRAISASFGKTTAITTSKPQGFNLPSTRLASVIVGSSPPFS